jgi:hypothetical protein
MVLGNLGRWGIVFSLSLENRQLLIYFCHLFILFIINFLFHICLFKHVSKSFFIYFRNRSLNYQLLLLKLLKSDFSFLLNLIFLLLQLDLFLSKLFDFVIWLVLGELALYLIAYFLYFKISCFDLVKTLLNFSFLLKQSSFLFINLLFQISQILQLIFKCFNLCFIFIIFQLQIFEFFVFGGLFLFLWTLVSFSFRALRGNT